MRGELSWFHLVLSSRTGFQTRWIGTTWGAGGKQIPIPEIWSQSFQVLGNSVSLTGSLVLLRWLVFGSPGTQACCPNFLSGEGLTPYLKEASLALSPTPILPVFIFSNSMICCKGGRKCLSGTSVYSSRGGWTWRLALSRAIEEERISGKAVYLLFLSRSLLFCKEGGLGQRMIQILFLLHSGILWSSGQCLLPTWPDISKGYFYF